MQTNEFAECKMKLALAFQLAQNVLFLDDETDLNWPNLLFGIFVNSMNCRTCVRPKNVIGQLIFANKKDDECSRCYQFVALSCKFDAELQGNVDSGFPFRFNNKKSTQFFSQKSSFIIKIRLIDTTV